MTMMMLNITIISMRILLTLVVVCARVFYWRLVTRLWWDSKLRPPGS